MIILWLDVLIFDSEKASRKAGRRLTRDPRLRQFWDPENRSGHALPASLGWEADDFAWDIYLFYDPQAEWTDQPPVPAAFMHQLPEHSDSRYHTGEDLVEQLEAQVQRLAGTGPRLP